MATGIGLALVKKIIEQYNGNIWVESVEGMGSTFHFTLKKSKQ
jgi:signal transduction histidine kinase